MYICILAMLPSEMCHACILGFRGMIESNVPRLHFSRRIVTRYCAETQSFVRLLTIVWLCEIYLFVLKRTT